ncbi:hypothetical protein [Streptomyces sp. NPDC001348]
MLASLPEQDRAQDRAVHRIGFGAMRLTGSGPFHHGTPSDRECSVAVLRGAAEPGVDHIDTAAFRFCSQRAAHRPVPPIMGVRVQP